MLRELIKGACFYTFAYLTGICLRDLFIREVLGIPQYNPEIYEKGAARVVEVIEVDIASLAGVIILIVVGVILYFVAKGLNHRPRLSTLPVIPAAYTV